jgi:hypothetical protein
MHARSIVRTCPPSFPPACLQRRGRFADAVFRNRRKGAGGFDEELNKRSLPCWSIPRFSIARFERLWARTSWRYRRISIERPGTRITPVVLPVEPGAR